MKSAGRITLLLLLAALAAVSCTAARYTAEQRFMNREEYGPAQDALLKRSALDAQGWALVAECRFQLHDYWGQLEGGEHSLDQSGLYQVRIARDLHEEYVTELVAALKIFWSGDDLETAKAINEVVAFGQRITKDISPRIFETNKKLATIATATAIRLKNIPQTENFLIGLRKEWKDRPELLERLALIYHQIGQDPTCVELCEQILQMQPRNSTILTLRTEAMRGSNIPIATLNALRDMRQVSHKHPILHRDMGVILFELGDWKQAATHLEAAYASRDADSLNVLVMIGECAYNQGDYRRALDYYRHALRIQPENLDILRAIGACHWNLGEQLEAKAAFDGIVLPAEPGSRADAENLPKPDPGTPSQHDGGLRK